VLVAAHGIPIVAAVLTSAILSRHLHAPGSFTAAVAQWGFLFAASTAVLLLVDRASKRLLPLAALLKLSMLFPDSAPKRLTVARKSGSIRNLEARLEEAKALGADDEPTRAAEVILALVGALHAHDRHTRGHSERVRWFTDLLAEELKLPEADRDRLRWASLLHDIGKLQISPKILNKPGKLVRREWRHIHRHPENGARIVAPLAPWLGEWAATVEQHHEKYDGSGYPHGLRGDEISLGARIVAVADAYEVMTAVRSYKKAASAVTARRELTASAGAHFDPAIVRAFLNISIGRLRWVTGPIAWVAQVPFVGWLPRLAEGAAAVGAQTAGAVGTAAVLSGGSVFVVGHDPIDVPDGGAEPNPGDVASVDPAAVTPTTLATEVLGETLRRAGATSGSSPTTVAVRAASTSPAPVPVVETHDNPSTHDDKAVAETTTSLPPTATAHRQAPADTVGPASTDKAPASGATKATDPVASTVDSVLPPGQAKRGG
jgi:putative nucleotidyltransferase with HDIG domain